MIRSSIGIVCVLVFITTCAHSTAAQVRGAYAPSVLRDHGLQSQLSRWIELADQGVSDRILSSDAYHDKFRFRAAPVKQSRNWKMPLVDVRPAKDITSAHKHPLRARPAATKTKTNRATNRATVFSWGWKTVSDLAVEYRQWNQPLEVAFSDFFPRSFAARENRSQVKRSSLNTFKLKMVEVKLTKDESPQPQRAMTTGRKDYWDYYGDCDRWDVVFAIPGAPSTAKMKAQPQVVNADVFNVETRDRHQQESKIAKGLQTLADLIANRWDDTISFCQTISKQLLASR